MNTNAIQEVTISQSETLPELATRANTAHRACLLTAGKTLEHARVAGEALAAAKSKVEHGEWSAWLAENFDGSARTSQVYTRIFRRWPEIAAKAQATALLTIEAAANLIAEPRPGRIPRTIDDPRPGPLPGPGKKLVGIDEPTGCVVAIQCHVDPAYVYLTVLEAPTKEGGLVSYSQRAIQRDYAYLSLERLNPNIDYDAIEWQESDSEPLEGFHPLHKPQWLHKDTGNERLNALEPIILNRCLEPEAARRAIKEVQDEGLYNLYADSLDNYLHARFHMSTEEIAGLKGGQE